MVSPVRVPLPYRRPSVTAEVVWGAVDVQVFTVTVGFDPETGKAREVFADGPKEGSVMQAVLADACTVVSVALQHGITPEALAKSLGTAPMWRRGGLASGPASPIGAILERVLAAAEEVAA